MSKILFLLAICLLLTATSVSSSIAKLEAKIGAEHKELKVLNHTLHKMMKLSTYLSSLLNQKAANSHSSSLSVAAIEADLNATLKEEQEILSAIAKLDLKLLHQKENLKIHKLDKNITKTFDKIYKLYHKILKIEVDMYYEEASEAQEEEDIKEIEQLEEKIVQLHGSMTDQETELDELQEELVSELSLESLLKKYTKKEAKLAKLDAKKKELDEEAFELSVDLEKISPEEEEETALLQKELMKVSIKDNDVSERIKFIETDLKLIENAIHHYEEAEKETTVSEPVGFAGQIVDSWIQN